MSARLREEVDAVVCLWEWHEAAVRSSDMSDRAVLEERAAEAANAWEDACGDATWNGTAFFEDVGFLMDGSIPQDGIECNYGAEKFL